MKRALILVFLLCFANSVQASSSLNSDVAERIDWGDSKEINGMIGGIAIDIGNGNTSNSTGEMSSTSWPSIAEIYTATWCVNCISNENVIDELAKAHPIERLHYHREYSESRDPFGTVEGDDRWIEKYGSASKITTGGLDRAAPSVVFNGEWLHSGTLTKGDVSLSDDFSRSLDKGSSIPLDGISASLEWTNSSNNSQGTVSWTISSIIENQVVDDFWDDDCISPSSTQITPVLFVVENVARFENGSNGLENYSHVIRDIHRFNGFSGSESIELPDIWDGEDFRLVMTFEWSSVNEQLIDGCEINEESGFLPGFGFVSSVLCLTIVSYFIRRND